MSLFIVGELDQMSFKGPAQLKWWLHDSKYKDRRVVGWVPLEELLAYHVYGRRRNQLCFPLLLPSLLSSPQPMLFGIPALIPPCAICSSGPFSACTPQILPPAFPPWFYIAFLSGYLTSPRIYLPVTNRSLQEGCKLAFSAVNGLD